MSALQSGIDWSAPDWEELRRRHRWTIPADLNVGAEACDRHADGSGRIALRLLGPDPEGPVESVTFDELADATDRCRTVLGGLGVRAGDRVAVMLPQARETAVLHLAALKHGAISVPLSPLFREEALRHRLGHSEAAVVVTDEEHLPFVEQALPERTRVVTTAELARLVARAVRAGRPHPTGRDDPAMLLYTSGTTGLPRGALHAHRFIRGRLTGFELAHRLESRPPGDGPFWTPSDWAWVGGLVDCVLTPLAFGCPVLGWQRVGFDPEAVLSVIGRLRVRSLFLAPTAVQRLRQVEGPVSRFGLAVESVHCAGEPLGVEPYRWAVEAFGPNVHELYGMTEMGATIGNSSFFPARAGSMGRPYPGHDVALIDGAGGRVPAGALGEVAVRRGDPGMFLGYFRDPEATAERFRGDWLLTGDLARCDPDGYFWYEGRADDVFNTSGYRVGPTEIEAVLHQHPAVEHAAVVGEPDPERGHVVKAFVVLRSGWAADAGTATLLQHHVRERLALYQMPRRVVFAHALPITTTGKVRRAELRAPDADARWGV